MMIIVDAHQDIAYNTVCYRRNYLHSVEETRSQERGYADRMATIGLPNALDGNVAVVFATIFAAPAASSSSLLTPNEPTYRNEQEAYSHGMKQVDYYMRLADASDQISLICTQKELDAVLRTWDGDIPDEERQQGLVILMEGADPIIEPEQFEEWYERGVRLVGPAWSRTRYSGGTGAEGGLTPIGFELLEVLARYNVLLDLSHMAEQAFLEAVDRYEGSMIASHSNPRKFVDSDRHLSDEMILRLAERDGVMGIVLFNRFLNRDWFKGRAKNEVPITRVIDIIDYVCQLTGDATHVGIGSDFDGGFGADQIPDGIDTVGDLKKIGDGLRERGYEDDHIRAILGGNMLRKLRESLP